MGTPGPCLWTALPGPHRQPPGPRGRAGKHSPGALTVGRRSSAMRAALGSANSAQPPGSAAPLGVSGSRCSPLSARSAIQIPRCSRPIGQPHARRALPIGWTRRPFCTLIGWLLLACHSNRRGRRALLFPCLQFYF